jgi:hypothetical protein
MIKTLKNCASVFDLFSDKVFQNGYNSDIVQKAAALLKNFELM